MLYNKVMEDVVKCRSCKNDVDKLWFYCPTCGKKLREKPPGTSFWSVLGLFLLSTLLPPFNLGLSIKYIRSSDPRAKTYGWISLALMVAAVGLAVWWSSAMVNLANKELEKQMEVYKMLGF